MKRRQLFLKGAVASVASVVASLFGARHVLAERIEDVEASNGNTSSLLIEAILPVNCARKLRLN